MYANANAKTDSPLFKFRGYVIESDVDIFANLRRFAVEDQIDLEAFEKGVMASGYEEERTGIFEAVTAHISGTKQISVFDACCIIAPGLVPATRLLENSSAALMAKELAEASHENLKKEKMIQVLGEKLDAAGDLDIVE
jgi:hypothetical protein